MEKNQPYKQDKVFDNILETEEFNVYTKIDDLPLDENPMYLEEGINGICTGGSALFNVFGNKRRIVSNDLVVIFRGCTNDHLSTLSGRNKLWSRAVQCQFFFVLRDTVLDLPHRF